jgi:DNA-binding IclR family transcriptional regulator
MVSAGYLTYDNQVRAFFPTPKILLKTSWLADTNSSLLDAMEDLRNMTGETVTLSCYRNTDMQVVQVILGSHPIALTLNPGDRLPLFTSAVGLAFLADQTDELLERIVRRAKKLAARDSAPAIDSAVVKDAVNSVRERGAAVRYGLVLEGVGAVAGAIRCSISGATYVLSVGGPDTRIAERESEIVKAVSYIIDSHACSPQGFLESTVRPGLERITRRFEAYFENELRDVGISSKESQVIGLLLATGALNATQIANLSLMSGSPLDETLRSLTTKDLITKDQAHYNLTGRGRTLASSLSEKLRSYRADALGPITPSETKDLQRMLDRLSEWIRSANDPSKEIATT